MDVPEFSGLIVLLPFESSPLPTDSAAAVASAVSFPREQDSSAVAALRGRSFRTSVLCRTVGSQYASAGIARSLCQIRELDS